MIKLTNELRAQFAQAHDVLVSNGWTKSHSICHDGGATGNFGTCYVKGGVSIYVNYKNVNALLQIFAA